MNKNAHTMQLDSFFSKIFSILRLYYVFTSFIIFDLQTLDLHLPIQYFWLTANIKLELVLFLPQQDILCAMSIFHLLNVSMGREAIS